MKRLELSLIIFMIIFLPLYASAEVVVSFQGAAVHSTRNDVAIPGNTGDKFSFINDLDSDTVFSPRAEAGYEFAGKHFVGLMASLLRIEVEGTFDRDIMFDDKLFAEGTKVEGKYRFDSYRATYRYYIISNSDIKLGAGLTGKIRDAEITLEGGSDIDKVYTFAMFHYAVFGVEFRF